MLTINNIQFNDSIRVIFSIKEKYNHKTLQETYKYLETQNIDAILDVLLISYNLAHKGNELTDAELGELFGDNNIGFAKMADIYAQLIEKILFSGMTPEEIEARKNQAMNLKK